MPGGGGQQQQSNVDNSMWFLWLMALAFVSAFIIWYFGHVHIVRFVFFLDEIQAKCILFFINSPALANVLYILQTVDPAQVKWADLIDVTTSVGFYTRYPVMVTLVICAFWLYWADVPLKFRKQYSMKTLRAQEQVNWPAIAPVIKEDLVPTSVDEGPWAMALLPMEFARKYDLLKKEDIVLDKMLPGMEMTAGLRKGEAKRIFTLQLGAYWEGFERCPAHVCALAAIFIARMNRDRDAARKILDTINVTYAKGKPNYAIARPVLKKYLNTEIVQEVLQLHGYVLTVMASLLQEARKDGVLASAEFLWLKVVDRRLWYMLNCVGRQVPYCEVGGPFSHWIAETAMKRRSRVPMIDEATKGLEVAIKGIKLTPKQMQELKP